MHRPTPLIKKAKMLHLKTDPRSASEMSRIFWSGNRNEHHHSAVVVVVVVIVGDAITIQNTRAFHIASCESTIEMECFADVIATERGHEGIMRELNKPWSGIDRLSYEMFYPITCIIKISPSRKCSRKCHLRLLYCTIFLTCRLWYAVVSS